MTDQRVLGAKGRGGATVPKKTATPASFDVVWDSDGFYQPSGDHTVLTIPRPKLRGRYQIRVAVRWMNPWNQNYDPPPSFDDYVEMYYHAYVTINDQLLGNEARATAAPVIPATGTTQYFAADANLGVGDSVGVKLWQSVGHEVVARVHLEIRRLGRRCAALTTFAPEPSDSSEDNG